MFTALAAPPQFVFPPGPKTLLLTALRYTTCKKQLYVDSREHPTLVAMAPGLCRSNPRCSPHLTPVGRCTCTVRAAPQGGSSESKRSAGAQHLPNSLARLHSSLSWGNGTSPYLPHDLMCQRTCCYLRYKLTLHQLLTCNNANIPCFAFPPRPPLLRCLLLHDSAGHNCAE